MQKGMKTQVLDHGYVTFIDSMGDDSVIVEAARMSTGKGFISWEPYSRCDTCGKVEMHNEEQKLKDMSRLVCGDLHKMVQYPMGDNGLLDNLWRNKHGTPFEMCELALEIQAPIMVFREWHRHRTQSFNEFSARYAQMPNLHYLPELERFQKQSSTNKQGSAEAFAPGTASRMRGMLNEEQKVIYEEYDEMVIEGLAKEVARLNTPVSRYSKMRAKTDIRNWLAFCNLRMRPGAQWEIRQFANVVGNIIKELFPKVWELFEEYDLYGVSFSRTEMKILRGQIGMGGLELSAGTELSGMKLKEFMAKVEFGGTKIL